jgi:hypothetical protein
MIDIELPGVREEPPRIGVFPLSGDDRTAVGTPLDRAGNGVTREDYRTGITATVINALPVWPVLSTIWRRGGGNNEEPEPK